MSFLKAGSFHLEPLLFKLALLQEIFLSRVLSVSRFVVYYNMVLLFARLELPFVRESTPVKCQPTS